VTAQRLPYAPPAAGIAIRDLCRKNQRITIVGEFSAIQDVANWPEMGSKKKASVSSIIASHSRSESVYLNRLSRSRTGLASAYGT
jgi:hypothetical protein